MSKKAKTPTDNIKRELFGGLSRTEVEKLLDNAAKEQARLTVRLESAQAELTRAQNEFEARTAAEAMLRSQVDHLREDSERLRLALEGEIQELREALARHQSDNYSGDQSDLLAQIERLRYELETANARLEEMVLLQAEVESLRHQLANATTENNSHYSGNTGEGDSQLLEEIERLQRELNAVPDLNEQIAVLQSKLMASEEGAELERANAEIERLTAELTNVPSLLQEIETLRSELASSPASADNEELKALRAEVERLHAQHAVVSTSNSGSTIDLDRTLIEARRILEDARAEAERERELIIDAAHHHAEEIVRRAQRQFSTEAWEIEKIRLERRRYLSMFKALLNRHLHEVEDLEVEPTSDLEESRPQFATVGMPDGEPPIAFSSVNETGSEEFRSPFSYPQADEPFHA